MPQRLENPDVDDLGQGGVSLSNTEFEDFLGVLTRNGIDSQYIALARQVGFIAPIEWMPSFEWAFKAYKMQADIKVLAVCRDDSLEAMQNYIKFRCREGTWPGG